MTTSIVLVLTALAAGFSGLALLRDVPQFTDGLIQYGVPRTWWPWLGSAKLAGAVGVVIGLWVPMIGVVAASCLVAYFVGAVVTVLRAKIYAHIPIPLVYLTLPTAAVVLLSTS